MSQPTSLRAATGLVLLCFLLMIAVMVMADPSGPPSVASALGDAGATIMTMLLPALLVAYHVRPPRFQFLPTLDRSGWTLLAAAFLLSFPLLMAQYALAEGLRQLGVPVWFSDIEVDFKAHSLPHLFALLISTSVATAFAEEALFRGVFQGAAIRRLGLHGGVWLTVVFFSAIHIEPINVITGILIFAPVVGYLRHWAGNLGPGIVVHAGNNAWVVLLISWETSDAYLPWLYLLCLPALFASAVLFQKAGVLPTRAPQPAPTVLDPAA